MNNSPSRTQLIAHIASLAAKSKTEDSDVLFFKGGVYKGEWNPNTIANQLPANTEADDIFLVSENGSYFGRSLLVGELVRFVGIHDPVLVYSKYLPITFILSMLNDEAPPTNTGGGFAFGGDWNTEATYLPRVAQFTRFQNASVSNNVLSPIATESVLGAIAHDIHAIDRDTFEFAFVIPAANFFAVALVTNASFVSQQNPNYFDAFLSPEYQTNVIAFLDDGQSHQIYTKINNNQPTAQAASIASAVNDDIVLRFTFSTRELIITNTTQNTVLFSQILNEDYFNAPYSLLVQAQGGTFSFNFDTNFAVQQYALSLPLPPNPNNKTYRVVNAEASSIFDSKLLKNDDFVTFYNDAQNIIVSRLYTDAAINTLANTAITNALEVDGPIYNAIQSAVNP